MHTQNAKFLSFSLLLVLVLAFALRVINLEYNSPFTDEAQYIVLGRKVLAGHWQEEQPFSWVGGTPLFYPVLAALFGSFGVVGARFLNAILGTASVYLLYRFAIQLRLFKKPEKNQLVGLVSSLFLAVAAIPLHLSRLATYDMLSFTLFLAGGVLWQRAFRLKQAGLWKQESQALLSAVFFFLAFLAKYFVIVMAPFLLATSLIRLRGKSASVKKRLFLYFFVPLLVLIGGYILIFFSDLREFAASQVRDPNNQSKVILATFLRYTLWAYVGSLVGVLAVWRRRPLTVLSLVGVSLLIPLVHLQQNSSSSVFQHTFLSLVFLLPLFASLFAVLLTSARPLGTSLLAIAFLGLFLFSNRQLRGLERAWHDSRDLMRFLSEQVKPSDRLLTQEGDVTVLALPEVPQEQIIGPFWFEYQQFTGEAAYAKALTDGYFTYVQLTTDASQDFLEAVQPSLGNQYQPVYSEHPYVVYRRL